MSGQECSMTPGVQCEHGNGHSVFYFYFISTLDEDQSKINVLSTPQERERFGIEDKSMEVNEKYLQ